MQDKIIALLKNKEGHISGEELAHRLKVSRQALWKHIQELRESGYEIAAVPHLGYKLESSPDRLFASEISAALKTKFIGQKIYYFDHIASTMDLAMQLGMKNAQEGTLVLAEGQTRGRGRLGRSWSSPKYKGIYFSLILRPKVSPDTIPLLTLLSAVSICEGINEATGLKPLIKWPNDIILENKKLGGILTELNADMDKTTFVVIGAGLNVNNTQDSLILGATSIREHKKELTSRVAILANILLKLEQNYGLFEKKGAPAITEKWRSNSLTLNKRVKVSTHGKLVEGTAIDIDSDGALLVRKDSGLVQRLTSGDVTHCR